MQVFATAWAGPPDALGVGVADALAGIVDPARAAWPAGWIDEADFLRHVAARTTATTEAELIAALRRATTHAADLWLACACARGSAGALTAFDAAHLSGLARVLRRVDDAPAFCDEVAQILREKLFVGDGERPGRIGEYDGRGSLAAWVRVIALRTALNLRRARTVVLVPDGEALEPATGGDAALRFAKTHYREPFEAAVRAAVDALDARGRTLLRLHYIDGLGIDKIAALYAVHRSSIARWLTDTREALRIGIRVALQASMGVAGRECDSMASALFSQVTLSLRSLLGPASAPSPGPGG